MERQFEYAHSHQLMAGDRADAMRHLSVEIALPRNSAEGPFMVPERRNSILAEVVLSSGGLDLCWRGLSEQLFVAQSHRR